MNVSEAYCEASFIRDCCCFIYGNFCLSLWVASEREAFDSLRSLERTAELSERTDR